jgi:formate hydrogenlyase subunit 4
MVTLISSILAAFFFPGLILKTKAFLSGRYGAGILQPWKDMWRLFKKGSVFSKTASIIFQIAPTVYLATVLCAMLLLPFDNQSNLLSFKGDFVFFAYILALGRFFMIIASLDTGSPFEGMGANREALYGMLIEPAFFIWAGSLAMLTGYTSFQNIYSHLNFDTDYFVLILGILATYLLVQIALVENSRMPVDDPTTHLELTMVHEAMVLDNSGFDLAIIQLSSVLKFVMYGTLIGNFFMMADLHWILNIAILLLVQFLFAVTIGIIESFRARNPLDKNPQFIIALSSIAIIIFFTVLIITQKYIT